ncbi:MAG: molybdenum cofactor biosynthesis protein MoaE [candidate division NC10 bacterium]|nr:molybdenum cofactor biosynthesis protein MoaE [candidate division NC10 bacterium]
MDIAKMIGEIRRHPEFHRAGMILVHNGVVRSTSRDGRRVRGLRVSVNHERLGRILEEQKRRAGIIDIRVAIAENQDLAVGEDVMVLIVAGDVRENVIAVLSDSLNLIKTTVTEKTEYHLP